MTSVLVVLFFAVVMVTVMLEPGFITLLKVPLPVVCVDPSIINWLTLVAVHLKDSVDVASLSLYMVIVAVLADAPIPMKPPEPLAVTVMAPLDMELSVAPLTSTVTPSTGVCVPLVAAKKAGVMESSMVS